MKTKRQCRICGNWFIAKHGHDAPKKDYWCHPCTEKNTFIRNTSGKIATARWRAKMRKNWGYVPYIRNSDIYPA